MLEQLVEQNSIEGGVGKWNDISFDIAFDDVETHTGYRRTESLRPDVQRSDVIFERLKGRGHHQRNGTVLQDPCTVLDMSIDKLEIARKARSVLTVILREPILQSGIVRLNSSEDLIQKAKTSL
jgi:hypothetical protein